MMRLRRSNAFLWLANVIHLEANQNGILGLDLLRGKRVFMKNWERLGTS
jgi:hypothetical protein